MRVVFFYAYISLCVISFTLWKITFRSIKRFCKSDRAQNLGCVWFVVMNNILSVGEGYFGACIQLCPDGIIIIAFLGSGNISSIQIF